MQLLVHLVLLTIPIIVLQLEIQILAVIELMMTLLELTLMLQLLRHRRQDLTIQLRYHEKNLAAAGRLDPNNPTK